MYFDILGKILEVMLKYLMDGFPKSQILSYVNTGEKKLSLTSAITLPEKMVYF